MLQNNLSQPHILTTTNRNKIHSLYDKFLHKPPTKHATFQNLDLIEHNGSVGHCLDCVIYCYIYIL